MAVSMISSEKYCFFCGNRATAEHHLIFGMSQRALAEEDGIKVPVCDMCHMIGAKTDRIHDNAMAEKLSKMLGQALWEIDYLKKNTMYGATIAENGREKFRKRYGKSYL